MKAVVVAQFGGPEVLQYTDVPEPKAGRGEIVIKVHSVSVNRILDCDVRAGKYPVMIQLPHVLGVDPCGEVIDVGAGVDRFKLGDRVATISIISCLSCKQCRKGLEANCVASQHIGLHRWGGYAEYVAVPARNAIKICDYLTFAEGTLITRHFPMAFNLLTSKTTVRPGEWVLVMGAAGALGSCCVQVAKLAGAKVIGAAGTDDRVALAKSYGADFGINYRTHDLAEEVMKLTDDEGVEVVCENIADPTLWSGAWRSLAIGGLGHRRCARGRSRDAGCEITLPPPPQHSRCRRHQSARRRTSPRRRACRKNSRYGSPHPAAARSGRCPSQC